MPPGEIDAGAENLADGAFHDMRVKVLLFRDLYSGLALAGQTESVESVR